MRNVTKQAIAAFNANRSKKIGNTEVIANGAITGLYLHDNLIAEKNIVNNTISITNAGWKTDTTKERLNGLDGVRIYQKKGVWYLNEKEWDGKWTVISK